MRLKEPASRLAAASPRQVARPSDSGGPARVAAVEVSRRWQFAALGLAILLLTALGWPALRLLGDNAFIVLMLLAGLAAALATRLATPELDDRTMLAVVLGIALAIRLVALLPPPLLSTDIYRYIWDGRVQAAGINPYRYVPADPALAGLRDPVLYPLIDRADYARTIYPPVAQAFFLLVTRISETVTGMRVALVACELATVAAVMGLLAHRGLPRLRIVAYAWHPLPVWEIAGNGHVDGLATALLLLGLWLALARRRALAGAAVIALGALAKPFVLLALAPIWRPWNWRMIAGVALVIILAYLPYSGVGAGVLGFLAQGYLTEQRIDSGAGFWALRVWRLAFGAFPGDTVVFIGLAATAILALALRAGFRRAPPERTAIGDLMGLLLLLFLLLSPDYPWYFLPVVPLLALTPSAPGWALTVGGFLLYDVVPGDPQVHFEIRAAILNGGVLATAVLAWRRRAREATT